jgi:DNA topoisomerase-1
MVKNLIIVESPAKAKTIEKFLDKSFTVKSSFGHIRDLPKKGLSIDVEHGFKPTYEVASDKKKVVSELKNATKSSEVWLASDEDREGEAIAWHLTQVLKLDPATTKRIVFHEITKSAIEQAIKNPRKIDISLVDAQQARRVLDRLVGYELSPVLWRKVRTGLSAGRVQTVAVRLIVEREREIRDFNSKSSFKVTAIFDVKGQELPAELNQKLDDEQKATTWLEGLKPARYTVEDTATKDGSRKPQAPFTTSSLQQEAARRLGYSVRQTMNVAQRLYEAGNITYMRTDSTLLSTLALDAAGSYIKSSFGDRYHQRRQYQTKNANAQEAHESIRPTDFNKLKAGEDAQQQKLYQLIWQRATASQMSDALVKRSEITIGISNHSEKFIAKGEILVFDGFMKVYGGAKDDTLLPDVKLGDKLEPKAISATQVFSRPAARYSEASLVRKLEELGIGRPSTYAPTINTIQSRGYIEKQDLEGVERVVKTIVLEKGQINQEEKTELTGADRSKLVPTPIAEVTNDFLVKLFPSVFDYDFTASMEEDFDDIAAGKKQWEKTISEFYKQFHPLVEKSAEVSRQEVAQARLVGNDPKSGEPIYARFGRYGPVLQRGEVEDDKKPQFAPMPAGANIDTVSLEQALEVFKLPRTVGKTEDGQEITANIGRFGPFIQVGKLFVSIKPLQPQDITEAEARKLYQEKLEVESKRNIKELPSGIKVLRGPYGPYVTDGKKNVRIPKTIEAEVITEEEAKDLLSKAPAKRKFNRRRAPKK